MMAKARSRLRTAWKIFRVLFLVGIGFTLVSALAFVIAASRMQRNFKPVDDAASFTAEHKAAIASIAKYRRPEDATYLTFPEWYLVFNPQEYAQFLRTQPPSRFPFFKSIAQFWRGYAEMYAIAARHYPFNAGDHLMVMVIGTSTTFEYTIKGLYEKSVGRFSEWTAGGATTEEDAFAAQVAQEYGDFVPTQPWFDFSFGTQFKGLWTDTPFFGRNFIRKCERKFFLSLEYGIKYLYAGLIRAGSHSVYGVADTEIYAAVRNISDAAAANPNLKRIQPLADGAWIVTLPHYQGFTDAAPVLAGQGMDFIEIAGNDEVLLTIVAPANWSYNLTAGKQLFAMDSLTGSDTKRVAIQAPTKSLGAMLRELSAQKLKIEHLFDY